MRFLGGAALALAIAMTMPAWCHALAQGVPSTDAMVDALTAPPKAGAGQSRGFRVHRDNAPPEAGGGAPAATPPGPAAAAPSRREIGVPLLFDLNSSTLRPESTPALANIAAALKSPKLIHARILLEGHTDASGEAAHNRVLSEQRAEAVKAALVRDGGLDASRLTTVGKGESGLANPADPLAAENRRVVLVNLSP